MTGRTWNGNVHYHCSRRREYRTPDAPAHSRSVAADTIDPLVWQAVTRLLQNPTLLVDAWENATPTTSPSTQEQDLLQSRLKTLERQWQRLLDLFQDERIDKAELSKRKEIIEQERQSIQTRLQQFNRLAQQERVKQTMLEDFAAFCQKIKANLENPTPQLKQEVIRLLIDHVVVGENEIVIKHIVPTDDDCRLKPGRRGTRARSFTLVFLSGSFLSGSKNVQPIPD
jgi:site-specific DNA recombinase